MKKARWMIYIMVLAVVLMTLTPIWADELDGCGDLSAEDCQLLRDAQIVTSQLTSGKFKISGDIRYVLRPSVDTFNIFVSGNGSFAPSTPSDRTVEALYEPFLRLNAGVNMTVGVSLPALNLNNLFSLELRYVDGIGYVDLSDLLPSGDLGQSWYGIDVIDYYRLITEVFPNSQSTSTESTPFMRDEWAYFAPYATVIRLPDVTQDGEIMAVFELSGGFADFLQGEANYRQLLDTATDGIEFNSEEERALLIEGYTAIFSSLNIKLTQSVNDAGWIHSTQIILEYIPSEAVMALEPLPNDPLGLEIFKNIELLLTFNLEFTQYGDALLVIAPENAELIPPITLLGGFLTGQF